MQTKFWQGTNFWIALGMAAGSIWGLTSEDITPIVSGVFGITGGLFAVREKIKSAAVNWVEWISSPNTWNYVVAAIAAIGNYGAIVHLFHAIFYHHGRGKEKDNARAGTRHGPLKNHFASFSALSVMPEGLFFNQNSLKNEIGSHKNSRKPE